jgi:hypothetical protein
MEDPESGWGVGTNAGGSIAYVDGNVVCEAEMMARVVDK